MFPQWLRELLCHHDFSCTTGTGIYAQKKNHEPLVMFPVMKLVCKKCHYEEDILAESEPAKK